jgi:multidrug efflux pump subunit AcrB
MSPEEVITRWCAGNTISPSGNIPVGDKYPIVPVNSVVRDPSANWRRFRSARGEHPVYLRDVGYVQDSADAPAGYALVNGRRAVYILATKRADASTLSVINNIKKALPEDEGRPAGGRGDRSQLRVRPVAVRDRAVAAW